MGMYDTINGEQVKCFPWVSLYKEAITYHGGDLKYYGDDDEVPYRMPHYNYGKNFVIYDLNLWSNNENHFTIHVIEDGKVKATYENEIGVINWGKNSYVVSYYGKLLNIHSDDDLISYRKAYRKYIKDCEKINEHRDELFLELINEMQEIAKANSDEKKSRTRKLTEIYAQIEHEEELNREEKKKIEAKMSYWYLDTTDIDASQQAQMMSRRPMRHCLPICDFLVTDLWLGHCTGQKIYLYNEKDHRCFYYRDGLLKRCLHWTIPHFL